MSDRFYGRVFLHMGIAAFITVVFGTQSLSWSATQPAAWNMGLWPLWLSVSYFFYARVVVEEIDRAWGRIRWLLLYMAAVTVVLVSSVAGKTMEDPLVPMGFGFMLLVTVPVIACMTLAAAYAPKKQKVTVIYGKWRVALWSVLSVAAFVGMPLICLALKKVAGEYILLLQLIFVLSLMMLTAQCKRCMRRPWAGYATILCVLTVYLLFAYISAQLVDNGSLATLPLAYFRDSEITGFVWLAVPMVLATVLFVENRYDVRVPVKDESEIIPSA